jgi:hypothetical protein
LPEFIEGKLGFLFAEKDSNRYLDQLAGVLVPDPDTKLRMLFPQINRHLICRELGARYIWCLVPGKERMLSAHLPPELGAQIASTVPPIRILKTEASRLNLNDIFKEFFYDSGEALLAIGNPEDFFHKTDTHWNHRGAFIVYQSLIAQLDDPRLGEVEKNPIREPNLQQGDLGTLAGLGPEPIIHYRMREPKISQIYTNSVENNGRVELYEGSDGTRPTAIVLGSSSVDFMKDFLLHHFSRALVLFGPDLSYEMVALERPDYVLHIQQERYILRSAKDGENFMSRSMQSKDSWEKFKLTVRGFVCDGGYFLTPKSANDLADLMTRGAF